MRKPAIILDPGHGMSNRASGRYDPGAVSNGVRESEIVMDWANEIRRELIAMGRRVVRTRINDRDPAPLGQRAIIARQYGGTIMLSIHCNAANGIASGTETFYRGEGNRAVAMRINEAVRGTLHTRNRGAKTEAAIGKRLAVMAFQPTFLLELGFIDHPGDREKMRDSDLRREAAAKIAKILAEF